MVTGGRLIKRRRPLGVGGAEKANGAGLLRDNISISIKNQEIAAALTHNLRDRIVRLSLEISLTGNNPLKSSFFLQEYGQTRQAQRRRSAGLLSLKISIWIMANTLSSQVI